MFELGVSRIIFTFAQHYDWDVYEKLVLHIVFIFHGDAQWHRPENIGTDLFRTGHCFHTQTEIQEPG